MPDSNNFSGKAYIEKVQKLHNFWEQLNGYFEHFIEVFLKHTGIETYFSKHCPLMNNKICRLYEKIGKKLEYFLLCELSNFYFYCGEKVELG